MIADAEDSFFTRSALNQSRNNAGEHLSSVGTHFVSRMSMKSGKLRKIQGNSRKHLGGTEGLRGHSEACLSVDRGLVF